MSGGEIAELPLKVSPNAPSSMMVVEQHGVESLPEIDRQSSIWDFMWLSWGGANSLATAVLGAFPIMFGLSFKQAVIAALLGLGIGSLVLAPMAIFGPINGTNNAVSSSAHFGVVGRIIGSFLSLLAAIAFFAISVWSSGDALVGAAKVVFHITGSDRQVALVYALLALAILIVCIYGFRMMLFVNKIAVVASTAMFLVGMVVFWKFFTPNFPGAGMTCNSPEFWPAFVSSMLIVLSNPISFGAFLGDWTRYIPSGISKPRLICATIVSQWLTFLPFVFGIMTMSIIAVRSPDSMARADYGGGLLLVAPREFLGPLLLLAVLSGLSTGTTSLYGTGLDFSSVLPKLTRPKATLLIGAVSCGLIFLGRFYFSLFGSISTFVSLIIVTTTPWMLIMMMGYVFRRGYYMPDAMQVFNRGQIGGPYWFRHGWNLAALSAWLVSSVLALLTVNIPGHLVGWLGNLAHGVDLSLLVALLVPTILYPLCLRIFPEPRAVYGPEGPRWVAFTNREIMPIQGERRA